MALIYDFLAHRTLRLLDDMSEQLKLDQCEMIDCKTCLSDVALKFEDNIRSLKRVGENLEDHQRACGRVQLLTEECQRVIEDNDLDELLEYKAKFVRGAKGKTGKPD